MEKNDKGPAPAGQPESRNTALIVASVLGIALALTWAVATLFEIAVVKALAAVVIGLFIILVAMFMSGIG